MAICEAEVVILGEATSESDYDREEISKLLNEVTPGDEFDSLSLSIKPLLAGTV